MADELFREKTEDGKEEAAVLFQQTLSENQQENTVKDDHADFAQNIHEKASPETVTPTYPAQTQPGVAEKTDVFPKEASSEAPAAGMMSSESAESDKNSSDTAAAQTTPAYTAPEQKAGYTAPEQKAGPAVGSPTPPAGNTFYGQGNYYSYPTPPNPNSFQSRQPYQNQPYYQYYPQQPKAPKPPQKHRGLKIAASVVGIVAIVTAFCLFGYWVLSGVSGLISPGKTSSQTSSETKVPEDSLGELIVNSKPSGANEYSGNSDGTLTAAAVIAKVRPSIVGIVNYKNSNTGIPTISGQGSGIIISSDGYIITNAHVVSGATMVTVVMDGDNEDYRATVKGIDTQSDLAVLKIDKKGLTAAELGDSSQTVLGESVIAIGNPGGLELAGSCTGGMVSGLNRTISNTSTGYAMNYIQTDAAINPGNSGGALVNMYGQVIGINSAKVSATGYEGLGFSIPINEAIPIINDLQQYGYVKNRAKIGISFQLISETVSQYYNYSIPAGLLITKIDENCDIANKGVQTNDIITKIDGNAITSTASVYSALQKKKPGEQVTLTIYRIGTRSSSSKTFEVAVTLSEDTGSESTENQ